MTRRLMRMTRPRGGLGVLKLLQNPTRTTTIDLVVVILCASVPDTGSDAYDTAPDAYDTASDTRLMCMTHTVRYASDMYQMCITKMSDDVRCV